MIVFSYRGVNEQGLETSGTVEALDKDDALKKLRLLEAQGLHDLTIEGVQQNGSVPSASAEPSRRFCGSCGQENLVQHQFCASCGKPLDETVQAQPATTKGSRKHPELPLWQRVFCLLCLGLTGWMLYATMPKSAPRHSAVKPAPTFLDLQASVKMGGGQFVITNQDSFDWTNVELEINDPGLFKEGYVQKISRLVAGETYTVGVMQFANKNGMRFNPLTMKAKAVSVWSDTPNGKGRWYGNFE